MRGPRVTRAPAWWRLLVALAVPVLMTGCEGAGTTDPDSPVYEVRGVVVSAVTGSPVVGAQVSIGGLTVETNIAGRFQLEFESAGPVVLSCTATGFHDFETEVMVKAGSVSVDVPLNRIEQFEFGDFALYIPASVDGVNTILVALGGPDTRGFVTGQAFGAPLPQLEASLQVLGAELRAIAAEKKIAILGPP